MAKLGSDWLYIGLGAGALYAAYKLTKSATSTTDKASEVINSNLDLLNIKKDISGIMDYLKNNPPNNQTFTPPPNTIPNSPLWTPPNFSINSQNKKPSSIPLPSVTYSPSNTFLRLPTTPTTDIIGAYKNPNISNIGTPVGNAIIIQKKPVSLPPSIFSGIGNL